MAAGSIGISRRRVRVTAFAVSAGLAGFGGGLLAMIENPLTNKYALQFGLFWVVIVVTLGARSIQAAIIAGFSFIFVPEILQRIDIGWLPDNLNPAENPMALSTILFGLGAITYSRHPEEPSLQTRGVHSEDEQAAGPRAAHRDGGPVRALGGL